MTQKERLLNYLKQHHTINPLEAWQHLGIYRLAAVVLLLRKDGHDIETKKTEVKNQFGEVCHVATYAFTEKPFKPRTKDNGWAQRAIQIIRGATEDLRKENDKYEQS
jgi:Helix-turn-helix domain